MSEIKLDPKLERMAQRVAMCRFRAWQILHEDAEKAEIDRVKADMINEARLDVACVKGLI